MVNWNDKFAGRTAYMRRSAIREILKLTQMPDIISFAGGLPAPELFPVERIQEEVVKLRGLEAQTEVISYIITKPQAAERIRNMIIDEVTLAELENQQGTSRLRCAGRSSQPPGRHRPLAERRDPGGVRHDADLRRGSLRGRRYAGARAIRQRQCGQLRGHAIRHRLPQPERLRDARAARDAAVQSGRSESPRVFRRHRRAGEERRPDQQPQEERPLLAEQLGDLHPQLRAASDLAQARSLIDLAVQTVFQGGLKIPFTRLDNTLDQPEEPQLQRGERQPLHALRRGADRVVYLGGRPPGGQRLGAVAGSDRECGQRKE